MSTHSHRTQKPDLIDTSDTRPVHVTRIRADDRLRNRRDVEPDERAMDAGLAHGGTQESRSETLRTRGDGGRKRSGAFGRSRAGRDISKRR
jgi:hypothetical protein